VGQKKKPGGATHST